MNAPVVHQPETLDAARALLEECARGRRRVGFVGGGTALGLGNPGSPLDVLVHTRGLRRIVDYAAEDQVIVAEAGVTLGELQALVGERGQWLGVDAPNPERATLGGLVAVGAFGPRRARYGGMRELLLGITLLRADGVLAKSGSKVVKNVAGFDLPKLMCGALGTLGLIGEVTLRLHPRPEASATVLFAGLDATAVVNVVKASRLAQLEPSSVVALAAEPGRYHLGLRFEGFSAGVERDVGRAIELGSPDQGPARALNAEGAVQFWHRHDQVRTRGTLRVRVAVLPSQLPVLEPSLRPLLAGLSGAGLAWYASLGIGFLSGAPVPGAELLPALQAGRAGVRELGGSLVVEAAPLPLRESFDAWGPEPSAFSVMRELKQRFDPEGRLNPGRFVGGL